MSPASHVGVKQEGGDRGLAAIARAIRANRVDVAAVASGCLGRIEARDAEIHAFAHPDAEFLSRRAYLLDRYPEDKRGSMHGVPIAVADVLDVENLVCARGSEMYRGRRAPCDADVVARLREAGAIPFGTTTSAEFGCFGPGRARSSVDADRTAGGSGAAAAVASGAVVFACEMRPDGMLSRPASYCGIYGLTVTRGVLSTGGVCSLGTSLEGLGFYVREAEDVGFLARALLGNRSVPKRREAVAYRTEDLTVYALQSPSGYRVLPPMRSAINRALTILSDRKVAVTPRRLPAHFVKAEACYDTMFSYEVSRCLTRDRDRAPDSLRPETLARIDQGRRIDASVFEAARRDAIALRSELLDLLVGDAVILDAAADGTAPPHEEDTGWSPWQAIWAIAGLPAVAIPCGAVAGLPVGVQVAAAPGREDLLARVACLVEDGLLGVRPASASR